MAGVQIFDLNSITSMMDKDEYNNIFTKDMIYYSAN